ncbi:MAG: hypothetical protein ABSF92_07960 [Candidatus Acidiferrales bacterium]
MMDQPHLPGFYWFDAIRNEALRTGVYVGIFLSAVFMAWLFVANYVHAFEPFAVERNLAAAAALALLAAVPLLRFLRHPTQLLIAGVSGWAIFAIVYRFLCFFFHGLSPRISATHLFMLGAVVYGIVALLARLVQLVLEIRNNSTPSAHGAGHAR